MSMATRMIIATTPAATPPAIAPTFVVVVFEELNAAPVSTLLVDVEWVVLLARVIDGAGVELATNV